MKLTSRRFSKSLRIKLLLPLLLGSVLITILLASASHHLFLQELKNQTIHQSRLLSTAINEAAKAAISDDEMRFAVEAMVQKEPHLYGMTVATHDPFIIWASSYNPGITKDLKTQSMLSQLRQSLRTGGFGHFFAPNGDLITLAPLSPRDIEIFMADIAQEPEPRATMSRKLVRNQVWHDYQSLPAEKYRGAIYLRFDWEQIRQASEAALFRLILIVISAIIVSGLVTHWFLERLVFQPIYQLSDAMQRQSLGDESARASIPSQDELSALGMRFNHLLDHLHERDQHFREIVNHLPIAVVLKDTNGLTHLSNLLYDDWFGHLSKEHPAVKKHIQIENRLLTTYETVTQEEHWPNANPTKAPRRVITTFFPIFDGFGKLSAIGSASTDVTELKEHEAMLNVLHQAISSTENGILIADATQHDNPIIFTNPAVERITGYPSHEMLGRNCRFLHNKDETQMGLEEVRLALKQSRSCKTRLKNFRKDGSQFWNDFSLSPVKNSEGKTTHYIGVQSDVTEQKENEERIENLAYYDTLTQIPNRRLFQDRLSHALKRSSRGQQHIGLLYLDLDNFKGINDTLGHKIGDLLLKEVAKRLVNSVRGGDTVARMGGDEFTVIVENLEPGLETQTMASIAENISYTLSDPIYLDNNELFATSSLGIAIYPQDATNADELIKNADTAMYHSKNLGRDNYQFFHKALDTEAHRIQTIEGQLRNALSRHEIELYYQPILKLDQLQVCSVEALMRWNNQLLGNMNPENFIPVAESSGLIAAFGDWTIEQACIQLKAWDEQGVNLRGVAVNLSPRQFRQQHFLTSLKHILDEHQLSAERLELEITESTVIKDPEKTMDVLNAIKAMGIRLSMDDFGTGYSSLSYLKQLPVNTVKIDKSFVRDIATDPGDAQIVAAIIAMAKGLGLETIAEGIETQQQLDMLREMGCTKGQGYYFLPPSSAATFSEWMQKDSLAQTISATL